MADPRRLFRLGGHLLPVQVPRVVAVPSGIQNHRTPAAGVPRGRDHHGVDRLLRPEPTPLPITPLATKLALYAALLDALSVLDDLPEVRVPLCLTAEELLVELGNRLSPARRDRG